MEAANEPVIEDFEGTGDGEGVSFETSYGASGDQSRAGGRRGADDVHFSLSPTSPASSTRAWSPRTGTTTRPTASSTYSVVVFVVRRATPMGIETWDDLVKPGVEIITPNPGSSGSARWNILAAWATPSSNGGTDDDAGPTSPSC